MPAPIEVLEMRRVQGAGTVRAFAKLKVGGFTIHGIKVIQQPEQRPWVALPQVPARAKADGSGAGWFPVIEATPDLMGRIKTVVLQHWQSLENFRQHSGDQL